MVLLFTQLEDSVKPGKVNTPYWSITQQCQCLTLRWLYAQNSTSHCQLIRRKPIQPSAEASLMFLFMHILLYEIHHSPVHKYRFLFETEIFLCGLAYRRHVFRRNGHRKRIFSKRLSRVKFSENAGFSVYVRSRTKTDVFEYNDAMHHLLLAQRMLRKGCHRISIDWRFRRGRRKRFQYATCQ